MKELNFDGDTFNDMKRDMNFVLQRLLGNMQEKECQEGTLTLKLDVSLVREYVPNYNPNIPGESREIAKPKFSHKVTSQMKVEDMKKGNLDTEMELFLNEETGEYEMRPVADTTQRSIFDEQCEKFVETLDKYQQFTDIRNVGAAVHSMIDAANEKMDDAGFDPDMDWTYLAKVFGSAAIPVESAEVIKKALKKAEKDGTITSKNKWQMIEYWAADYLAGK